MSSDTTSDKQQFVKEAVRKNPNASMFEIGEMIKSKYGSMLSFGILRSAFLDAGGKLGKRGRKPNAPTPAAAAPAKAKVEAAPRQSYQGHAPRSTEAKLEYVREMVAKQPEASMYEIGEMIKTTFGSMLSFGHLREAFLGAGGKVGKRGRRPGVKNKAESATPAAKVAAASSSSIVKSAAAKAGKRGRRPAAETDAKKSYVADLVAKHPDTAMYEIGEMVKEKFGSALSFAPLRESFIAAGGTLGKRGRKPGTKNKTTKAAAKPAAKAAPAAKPVAAARQLPEKRGPGRRTGDYVSAVVRQTLESLPKHMVVITDSGAQPVPFVFGTKDEASRFVQMKLGEGIDFKAIGYYTKQGIEVSVTI